MSQLIYEGDAALKFMYEDGSDEELSKHEAWVLMNCADTNNDTNASRSSMCGSACSGSRQSLIGLSLQGRMGREGQLRGVPPLRRRC